MTAQPLEELRQRHRLRQKLAVQGLCPKPTAGAGVCEFVCVHCQCRQRVSDGGTAGSRIIWALDIWQSDDALSSIADRLERSSGAIVVTAVATATFACKLKLYSKA